MGAEVSRDRTPASAASRAKPKRKAASASRCITCLIIGRARRIEPQRHRGTENTQRKSNIFLCVFSVPLCLCGSILLALPIIKHVIHRLAEAAFRFGLARDAALAGVRSRDTSAPILADHTDAPEAGA